MTHPSWVAPLAWLSFIELDKAVVLVVGAFEVFTGVPVLAVGGLCELEAGWERSLHWASPGDACRLTGPRREAV